MTLPPAVALQTIAIVGSGDEDAIPHTSCLLSEKPCKICLDAHKDADSPNRRNQTCFLLSFTNNASMLVNCPMTFRDSVLRCSRALITRATAQLSDPNFVKAAAEPIFRFPSISSFIATSSKFLSIGGIDDLREVTIRGETVTLIASQETQKNITRLFPYILPAQQKKKAPVDAKQAALWTAHLQPRQPTMQDGAVHKLAENYRSGPVPEDVTKIKPDVASARAVFDGVLTAPLSRAQFAAAAAEKRKARGDDDDDDATVIPAPAPGAVDMMSLQLNDDEVGFALSLAPDGKLPVVDFENTDDGDFPAVPAVVYLPGDIFDDAVCTEERRNVLIERMSVLRVVLAIVHWPSQGGAAALGKLNEKVFYGAERVVVVGIPHTVSHLSSTDLTKMIPRFEHGRCKNTCYSMGTDGSLIFQSQTK